MTKFRINIKQLTNNCSDFENQYSKYKTSLENYYKQLNSLGSVWSDGNTEYYIEKKEREYTDIGEFNKKTKIYIKNISNFTNSLTRIASRCGVVNPNILTYDGQRTLDASARCSDANVSFGWAKYTLSHYWAPNSFRYKWQYDNLRYQMQSYADRISSIEREIRSIYDDVERSVNELRELSSKTKVDELRFDKIEYKGYVEDVDSIGIPDDTVSGMGKYSSKSSSLDARNDVVSSEEVDDIVSAIGRPININETDIHSDYEGEVINSGTEKLDSQRDEKDIHSDYEAEIISSGTKNLESQRDEKDLHSDYSAVSNSAKTTEIDEKIEGSKTDKVSSAEATESTMSLDNEVISSENVETLNAQDNEIEILDTDISSSEISEHGVSGDSTINTDAKVEAPKVNISEQTASSNGIEVNKVSPSSSTTISSYDASSSTIESGVSNVSNEHNVSKLDADDIFIN